MRPHNQFSVQDHDRAGDEQEKAEQQFHPILMPADKVKTYEHCGQEIEEAAQDNQAVIISPLKDLVNDGLEQPVVIIPRLGRGNIGKESVPDDRPALPEMPPAGEMIPQIGISHHDRPCDKIADQEYEEQGDQEYGIISMTGYVLILASVNQRIHSQYLTYYLIRHCFDCVEL